MFERQKKTLIDRRYKQIGKLVKFKFVVKREIIFFISYFLTLI